MVSNTRPLEFLFLMILIFFHFSINKIEPENSYAWMASIIAWGYGIYNVRKSLPLTAFYLFIFSYISMPYYHYFSLKQISFYTDFQSEVIINQVAFLNTMFLSVLGYFIAGVNDSDLDNPREWCRSNKYIFYISLLPCLFSLLFGLSGESIISAGYGSGLSSKSALHEYFIVFSLFGLLFMNSKSRLQLTIWGFLVIAFSLKTLIYGGRIEVIQLMLLWAFAGLDYLKAYSKSKLLFLGSVFLLVMFTMGIVRGNLPSLIVAQEPMQAFFEIILKPDTNPYVLSTSADVYYASMRLIGMLQDGYLELDFRLMSFISFIFNLPLTFSSLKDAANLASLYASNYSVGGGGLISTYFFIWMGYLGVAVGAAFLGFTIRQFYQSKNMFWRSYGIMVLVTFPRWWAYTPINLTKLCIVSVILYVFYLALASLLKPSR